MLVLLPVERLGCLAAEDCSLVMFQYLCGLDLTGITVLDYLFPFNALLIQRVEGLVHLCHNLFRSCVQNVQKVTKDFVIKN